jgi:hypothetical protein
MLTQQRVREVELFSLFSGDQSMGGLDWFSLPQRKAALNGLESIICYLSLLF